MNSKRSTAGIETHGHPRRGAFEMLAALAVAISPTLHVLRSVYGGGRAARSPSPQAPDNGRILLFEMSCAL